MPTKGLNVRSRLRTTDRFAENDDHDSDDEESSHPNEAGQLGRSGLGSGECAPKPGIDLKGVELYSSGLGGAEHTEDDEYVGDVKGSGGGHGHEAEELRENRLVHAGRDRDAHGGGSRAIGPWIFGQSTAYDRDAHGGGSCAIGPGIFGQPIAHDRGGIAHKPGIAFGSAGLNRDTHNRGGIAHKPGIDFESTALG